MGNLISLRIRDRSSAMSFSNAFFAVMWVVFVYLAVSASKSYTAEALYDPFEILNLPLVRRRCCNAVLTHP